MTGNICGATKRDGSGEECQLPAGWGTDHTGEGRCKLHGGAGEGGGAPENNGNAVKHNLHADRGKLYERMDGTKQQRVDALEAALIERYREFHDRDPDRVDVSDFFEIAMSTIQREFAREYMAEQLEGTGNPLIQEAEIELEDGAEMTVEQAHDILDKITDLRREDRLLKKHMGLFKDPDTQQAEATETLAEVLANE